jgi:hypothetical protein
LGVGLHVAAQRLAEELAHGAVFAVGQLLGFEQEVGRQGDRDGLGGAHSLDIVKHGQTLSKDFKTGLVLSVL